MTEAEKYLTEYLNYLEIEKKGIMLPVIEAVCKYRNPAKYDDLLEISGWAEEIKGAKLTIRCEVRKNGDLLVEGHTIHACVEIASRRPIRPPDMFMKLLE